MQQHERGGAKRWYDTILTEGCRLQQNCGWLYEVNTTRKREPQPTFHTNHGDQKNQAGSVDYKFFILKPVFWAIPRNLLWATFSAQATRSSRMSFDEGYNYSLYL